MHGHVNLVLPFRAPARRCAHRHWHPQYLWRASRCLAAILCIPPPPFLIHHFYTCFSQITCARLWPWCPAECKCSSAANCLHHMDHQRTPWAQPEHPTGSRVRAAQSSEWQKHGENSKLHLCHQISADTGLKLLIKQVIKLLISASTILDKDNRATIREYG